MKLVEGMHFGGHVRHLMVDGRTLCGQRPSGGLWAGPIHEYPPCKECLRRARRLREQLGQFIGEETT